MFGKQSKNKFGQILTNFEKCMEAAPFQKSNSPHIKCRLFLDEWGGGSGFFGFSKLRLLECGLAFMMYA